MPAITYPNLGLKAGFTLGEDGWDDEMTLNILTLSLLAQGAVISKVAATPGAPTDGDVHIFSDTHPTEPNKIAARVSGAWVYITPLEGWKMYNKALDYFEIFTGAVWTRFRAGSGNYRLGFSIETTAPAASEVLFRHVFTAAVTFDDDFAGSFARLRPTGANPATNQVFNISINAAIVGTLTITTAGARNFVTTAGTVVVAAGDEMRVDAPAAPDVAIIGVSVSFVGTE